VSISYSEPQERRGPTNKPEEWEENGQADDGFDGERLEWNKGEEATWDDEEEASWDDETRYTMYAMREEIGKLKQEEEEDKQTHASHATDAYLNNLTDEDYWVEMERRDRMSDEEWWAEYGDDEEEEMNEGQRMRGEEHNDKEPNEEVTPYPIHKTDDDTAHINHQDYVTPRPTPSDARKDVNYVLAILLKQTARPPQGRIHVRPCTYTQRERVSKPPKPKPPD
jgi:hypothetical protein